MVAINRIQYKISIRSTLLEVIAIFKGLSESKFCTGSENYMVPVLILWATRYREAEDLLEEWSSFAEQPLSAILTRSFHVIFFFLRYFKISLKSQKITLHSPYSLPGHLHLYFFERDR